MSDDADAWKGEDDGSPFFGGSWITFGGKPKTPEELAAFAADRARRKAEGALRFTMARTFSMTNSCEKCGHDRVRVRYVPEGLSSVTESLAGGAEHMWRTCKRCGYAWAERVPHRD